MAHDRIWMGPMKIDTAKLWMLELNCGSSTRSDAAASVDHSGTELCPSVLGRGIRVEHPLEELKRSWLHRDWVLMSRSLDLMPFRRGRLPFCFVRLHGLLVSTFDRLGICVHAVT
jgi:hypothetical protein